MHLEIELKRQIVRGICGSAELTKQGEVIWKTHSHPSTTTSNEPSSNKFALNSLRHSLATSRAHKCYVFFGSPKRSLDNYKFWNISFS